MLELLSIFAFLTSCAPVAKLVDAQDLKSWASVKRACRFNSGPGHQKVFSGGAVNLFRSFLFVLIFVLHTPFAHAETWDVTCKNKDCFRNGWTTLGDVRGFHLEAYCTHGDCRVNGWKSIDNFGTRITVKCLDENCYGNGWESKEIRLNRNVFLDRAECADGNCLTHGWKVSSSYDDGGRVQCEDRDCSKFGGRSYWRSRRSITVCKSHDCYHKGWTVHFLDPAVSPTF
jgi:hypothetical protein